MEELKEIEIKSIKLPGNISQMPSNRAVPVLKEHQNCNSIFFYQTAQGKIHCLKMT